MSVSPDERLRQFLETKPVHARSHLKGPAAVVSRLTPRPLRAPLRALATRLIAPISRRRVALKVDQLKASGDPILLHLGCGRENKAGYINIDLIGARVDIALDLARGIPLPDQSVDGIFHEHVLGELPVRVGFHFLCECYRVLKPGGVLRVVVPDAGACIESYAGLISPEWADSAPVPLMAVEDLFYGHRYVTMYDATKLKTLMRLAGLHDVEQRKYAETALKPIPDTERRSRGGLRVEGVR